MGIPRLTKYIFEDKKKYLKPYKLSDSLLVVDGNCISHRLTTTLESNDGFGGDYDEYKVKVEDFLSSFVKCNIAPIFLFDGVSVPEKLDMRLFRKRGHWKQLTGQYCPGMQFTPLLFMEVFLDLVRDKKFLCIQCDAEADPEISALARNLNCPVLSSDSDFFILDALYIPFTELNWTPMQDSSKYYMLCSTYHVNDFLKERQLDRCLLPMIATILGNDFGNNTFLIDFLNHLHISGDEMIPNLTLWLKTNTLTSAIDFIIKFINEENVRVFFEALNKNQKFYNNCTISSSVFNELSDRLKVNDLKKRDFSLGWPIEIANLFSHAWIPNFVMTMALYQFYVPPIQVENTSINAKSPHLTCLRLITKIYEILSPYLKNKKPLSMYLMRGRKHRCINIPYFACPGIKLDEILKEPKEKRWKLFFDIIGIPVEEAKTLLCNSWGVFLMSVIYWVKELKSELTPGHVHAIVIMAIATQIVQTKVGYYREVLDFTKSENWMKFSHGKKFKLKNGEMILESSSSEFEEMLENVEGCECLLVEEKLIPLRGTISEFAKSEYHVSIIHSFNSFQACLFYFMVINSLLNYPFHHLRVGDFYSGTLLFNLYVSIKSEPDVNIFGWALFQGKPNLNKIYEYLTEKLCSFLE